MTKTTLLRRVERIEARQAPATLPLWVSVATMEDVPAALAALPGPGFVNLYVGISPDDWDDAQ